MRHNSSVDGLPCTRLLTSTNIDTDRVVGLHWRAAGAADAADAAWCGGFEVHVLGVMWVQVLPAALLHAMV
jgi:hypothetical protein